MLGYLVVHGRDELTVPIVDQLFVGRECAGISEQRRLVLSEKHISRNHFEIRLIADLDLAVVIDTSTNGTALNGMPLARTVAAPIVPGDRITVGDIAMTFRSDRFAKKDRQLPTLTQAEISQADMVMVVGDILSYSTISEVTDSRVLAESMSTLWWRLDELLRAHHGTLNHYAGDAIYAVWNTQTQASAHAAAIDFALAADRAVATLGPSLTLRDGAGAPIRMGWAWCTARPPRPRWRSDGHDPRRLHQPGLPVGEYRRPRRPRTGPGDRPGARRHRGPLPVGRTRRGHGQGATHPRDHLSGDQPPADGPASPPSPAG